ncbi:MAG: peptidoglycan DD-metalloendopeptidase family protein [Saprospiraceae bacterium]|nr:peptidoglycan DD-metalloendopeptidase family protein [Saprospiraceae bacterium]
MELSKAIKIPLQISGFTALLLLNGFILQFILDYELFKHPSGESAHCNNFCSKDLKYGFDINHFQIQDDKIKSGQILPNILSNYGLSTQKINKLIPEIQEVLDLKNIKSGNTISFISTNPCCVPDYFVYEVDASRYLLCDLSGISCPRIVEKETEIRKETVAGTIQTSLWNALQEQGVCMAIIDQMEDALATSIDFLHLQQGNSFKLIFERPYVEGKPINAGNLIAAYFNTENRDHYAFKYKYNNKQDYYDQNGRPLRRSFLRAPVRFSRITSPFSLKRFHPVLKYNKPHFGTDYAAPHGTPIMAVADGTVTAAAYAGGNGKYVKIRHDKTYETQYLHMSRFAAGIKAGAHVRQGQTIGYVGSTGLATGPHVCFRFWKNGVQVDHRKHSFPAGDPLPKDKFPEFAKYRDSLISELNQIPSLSTAYHHERTMVHTRP